MVLGGLAAPLFLAGIGTERGAEPGSTDWTSELVRWAASLGVTLVALRFVALFEWLHLFAADYLIGSLLLVGLLLWKGRRTSMTLAGTLVGILGAAYVIGVFLCLVGSELMHLVPSGTQWLRLPVLTAAGLPLCLHDEQVFRPVRPWWKRWLFFALTRSLLWAAVVTGVLLFNPPSAFLVLIMHFVVVFWLVVWWMAGFVARRTGEPGAAALFTSLVQGWVFAAVFVRI